MGCTWRIVLALAGVAAGGACAQAQELPPINSPATAEWVPGKFVWADLFTSEPESAAQFYSRLFGWQESTLSRPNPGGSGSHPYIILSNGGRPVAGIALRPARSKDAVHARWVGYVSVPDVNRAIADARRAGARVLFAPKTLPERGTQAILFDPDGAEVGLIHSSSGDPADYAPDPGDWTWAQLFSHDPNRSAQFYANIAGYQPTPDSRDGQSQSVVLVSQDYSRAVVSPVPDRPGARPVWLLFVRVADVKEAVSRVTLLGGRVLIGPSDQPKEYWKAIVADPTGGVLGLVQLDESAERQPAPPAESQAQEAHP